MNDFEEQFEERRKPENEVTVHEPVTRSRIFRCKVPKATARLSQDRDDISDDITVRRENL